MKPRLFGVACLMVLAAFGCRSDPAIPILERELRLKEDEIYRLRASLEEMQDCAESCQIVTRDDGGSRSAAPAASPPASPRRGNGSSRPSTGHPPVVEMPSQPATEVPDTLKSPAGSLPPGVPEVPKELQGPTKPAAPDADSSGSSMDGPSLERSTTRRPGRAALISQSSEGEAFTPTGDSRRVAGIVLDRTLTGGINDGEGSGDMGLLVVVEPRDRAGRTLDAPADMSVAVIDPAIEGEAARIARWDFTAAEIASMFRRSGPREAIYLTTTWSGDPPIHNKLHLFVRYITADGRKLQTDMPIEVALAGDKTARLDRREKEASARPEYRDAKAPHTASRSEKTKLQRPVWSPDRR